MPGTVESLSVKNKPPVFDRWFLTAEKITEGQYKFIVDGKLIYALWSGTLPSEISGNVKMTNMLGVENMIDASEISLQLDQPVFVEPVPTVVQN